MSRLCRLQIRQVTKMERDSFVFYRSFYDSIRGLGDAEFAECMRFLCEYALNDRELEGGTLAEVVLKMAKPQIEGRMVRKAADRKPVVLKVKTKNQKKKPVVLKVETIGYGMQNLM